MEKREKWTISSAIGGKVAVAYRLKNGRPGNAILIRDTEEDAWKFIDSGLADELDRKGRKPVDTRGSAAVEWARKRGLKGGAARAASMTPERRSEIAKKAAAARWKPEH
jgi:tRNA(Ile2) C34 agmatinyltransferase TiaS